MRVDIFPACCGYRIIKVQEPLSIEEIRQKATKNLRVSRALVLCPRKYVEALGKIPRGSLVFEEEDLIGINLYLQKERVGA